MHGPAGRSPGGRLRAPSLCLVSVCLPLTDVFCLFVCLLLLFFFFPPFVLFHSFFLGRAEAPSLHFLSASLQLMGTTFMLCFCCTPKCQFLSEGSFYVHLVPRFLFLVPWALQLWPEHLAV